MRRNTSLLSTTVPAWSKKITAHGFGLDHPPEPLLVVSSRRTLCRRSITGPRIVHRCAELGVLGTEVARLGGVHLQQAIVRPPGESRLA
jgi:hypothetical protein